MATPGPAIGFLQEALRWWDHWLKGIDTGIMDEPAYRVWLQEATPRRAGREEQPGRWIAEAGWPSPRLLRHRLFLNAGRLEATAEAEQALTHRSPLHAGTASGAWCPYGTGSDLDTDQREDDGRSLVFDSAPLTTPFDLLGAPELVLELAVDRPVAQIAARLCDIDGTGASSRVTYGVLNLTHRDSHELPTPLEPGRRYRVRLALNHVAYRFAAGHRLRLALSTSYWPTLWPAPEPFLLTLYTGASELALPIRPPRPEDAALRPFGEPEGASPPTMTTLSPDRRSRVFRHDLTTDVAELIIESDDGEERLDRLGLSGRTVIREHYRIAGDDPLSAEARYDWTMLLSRDDWRIRIEARTAMSATATEFIVGLELAAFEGDERIFERRWDRRIRRDLV
jgi:predicted acyl esterase